MVGEEKVLVVDDEEVVREIVTERLGDEGFQVDTASDGQEAFEKIQAGEDSPYALVLTDHHMPRMKGLELVKKVHVNYPDISLVVMTSDTEVSTAVDCMKEGAYDYIRKPFDLDDLTISVKRALRHRRLEIQAREYEKQLEERVKERTAQLISQIQKRRVVLKKALQTMMSLVNKKRVHFAGEGEKIKQMALRLAKVAAFSAEDQDKVSLAARFCNIGMVAVEDGLINKEGELTEEERERINQHVDYTVQILSPLEQFEEVLPLVRAHQERPDGKGYPQGLTGDEIPRGAKVIALAKAYVAMTSDRPYRSALSREEALTEIEKNGGSQFDQALVSLFLKMMKT